VLFAVFASIAAFGIGNMVQSNAVSKAMTEIASVHIPLKAAHAGLITAVLTGLVIIGGIKGIGRVAGILVPLMIVLYITGGLYIIITNYRLVGDAFALIFQYAFTPMAGAGGVAGFTVAGAVRYGVARGIFSNESGLGSAPIAAAAAKTNNPVSQALVSMTQTFIDTLVVCTITGILIIMSGAWKNPDLKGLEMTNYAFSWGMSGGKMIVSVGLLLFATSTIIGW